MLKRNIGDFLTVQASRGVHGEQEATKKSSPKDQ